MLARSVVIRGLPTSIRTVWPKSSDGPGRVLCAQFVPTHFPLDNRASAGFSENMRARVMISSVTKDEVPIGDLSRLSTIWNDAAGVRRRLGGDQPGHTVTFTVIRSEVRAHLVAKYGFDAYIFEETPGP